MTIQALTRAARAMFTDYEPKPSTLLPQLRVQIQGARERYHQELAALVANAATFKRPSTGESWGNLSEIGADDGQALAEFLQSDVIQRHQTRFSGAPEYVEQWQGETAADGSRIEYRKVRVIAR